MSDEIRDLLNDIDQRLRHLEAGHRLQIIRQAARFGADVHVARGLAPLGWDGETRAAFEEEVSKYLDAELTRLDQDEANAMALSWMEPLPAGG